MNNNEKYINEIGDLTRKLRDAYYSTVDSEDTYPDRPNGGDVKDSTTNTPAFYLEGPHCLKSCLGCCTNCFYSMYPQHDSKEATEKMKKQVDWILDNFDDEVIKKQDGPINIDNSKFRFKDKEPIVLTVSPTGSYFSEYEFPKEVRMYFLKSLIEKSEQYERDIVLHIEAHASDVANKGIEEDEAELLRQLNAKCILGFESSNDFSRNVLYNKKLSIDIFKKAVKILQEQGIDVGAFIIGGLITYTDIETENDMLQSVRFLKEEGVFPVMMFSNIQQYTLPDMLHSAEKYKLLQPFTVLDTVYKTLEIIKADNENPYWMIPEPVSGPPIPKNNIFYNRQDTTTSDKLNREMHRLLFMLRMTRDDETFMKNYEEFVRQHKDEYRLYYNQIGKDQLDTPTIEERLEDIISFATKNMQRYINESKSNNDIEENGVESGDDITIKTETLKSLGIEIE